MVSNICISQLFAIFLKFLNFYLFSEFSGVRDREPQLEFFNIAYCIVSSSNGLVFNILISQTCAIFFTFLKVSCFFSIYILSFSSRRGQ